MLGEVREKEMQSGDLSAVCMVLGTKPQTELSHGS